MDAALAKLRRAVAAYDAARASATTNPDMLIRYADVMSYAAGVVDALLSAGAPLPSDWQR
jgi:hypothetical protein